MMKVTLVLIACVAMLAFSSCHRTEIQKNSPATFEELSEQGYTLCRKGNYIEGMTLLHAANDSLSAMPPDKVNPEGAVMLLGNLANLYIRMSLFDEAKQTNSEAMSIAEAYAPERLPDLWRMRGMIYECSNQPDSQIICMRRAIEMCERITDEDFRLNAEKVNRRVMAGVFIENPDFAPDSVAVALDVLERMGSDDPTSRFLIGRAYVILGDNARGLPLMEQALATFRRQGDTESLEWGLQLLAQSYAEAGDRKLLDIYSEAASLHDTIMQRQRDNLLLGMDFKYRVSQLTHEKTILQNELRTKRQKNIFIAIIFNLIVAVMVTFFIMRNRNNRRQLRLRQQNIDDLLAERIALNTRIEELNRVLTESNVNTKRQEMLQTIILEKDDEQRFRKSFNDLHPGFIDRLRREYPELTAGNELLCMLIAMNRRNEEIALALGISRESVATSRYRLRGRFNLSKDTDLNDFIQSRL